MDLNIKTLDSAYLFPRLLFQPFSDIFENSLPTVA